MNKEKFARILEERVFILDGALGTCLMTKGMPKGVSTEQWILEHPDVLQNLQREYLKAGSQIVYTPTFGTNALRMKEFGMEEKTEEYNRRLAALSREVAEGKCLIAGDIGPTNTRESYEVLYQTYEQQMRILVEEGVDLFVIETMYNMDEAMAAIDAAHAVCELPVVCSMTVEADGSLSLGGNVYEAAAAFEAMEVDAVGVNCSLGPDQLETVVNTLHNTVSLPLIVKPNAGVPYINDEGQAIYSMTPEDFALHMETLIHAGARLVGGCCGTTPDYIRALKERVEKDGR